MSVPQSERKQSQYEYVTILQQIELDFLYDNADTKRRVPLLSEELCRLSMEAYNNATCVFEMTIGTIKGNSADQKKYCKKAIWSIRELAAQINILIMHRMKNNFTTQKYVDITARLLKAINLIQAHYKTLL